MNILIAPNSMKGSLSAFRFSEIVEKAFKDVDSDFFSIKKLPVADGGDMTAEVLTYALNLKKHMVEVLGPLLSPVNAEFGYDDGTAVIEMANASGMRLLAVDELNPMKASSFGTGQLIMDAVCLGAKKIYLGIGGSATVDGGMGMLEAMGAQFFDEAGNKLAGNGANLSKISDFEFDVKSFPRDLEIKIICDVDNPLLGEHGAANVFAPQKGANSAMVAELEKGLHHFSDLIFTKTGIQVQNMRGAGAAGGISIGLAAFLGAEIVEGANFVLDQVLFDEHAQWADIVITGEGRIDTQTLHNKAPFAVALRAKKYGKKVIAIGGSVEPFADSPFDAIFSIINKPCSLEYAMQNSESLLAGVVFELAKFLHSVF